MMKGEMCQAPALGPSPALPRHQATLGGASVTHLDLTSTLSLLQSAALAFWGHFHKVPQTQGLNLQESNLSQVGRSEVQDRIGAGSSIGLNTNHLRALPSCGRCLQPLGGLALWTHHSAL